MSQGNEKVVREVFRAWVERDPEAVVECFHPDVELLLPRNVLEGGSYRGHEGVRRALTDAFQTWEDVRFDIGEIKAVDERVVVVGRTTAVGKVDAPEVDYQSAYPRPPGGRRMSTRGGCLLTGSPPPTGRYSTTGRDLAPVAPRGHLDRENGR